MHTTPELWREGVGRIGAYDMMRGRQFSWKNAFFSMVMSFFNGFFSAPH